MASASYEIIVDTSRALASVKTLETALAGLASGAAIAGMANLADTVTGLDNKFRQIAMSGQTASQVFDFIGKSANELGVPLESMGNLFARIAKNTQDLGLTQQEQLTIVEKLNKAYQNQGATAAEATNSAIQFGQALGAGALRGQELNSVLDLAPEIAQAVARSLHVQVGALKALASQGKLTSEVVAKAVLTDKVIDKNFETRIMTISNALAILDNTFKILTEHTLQDGTVMKGITVAIIDLAAIVINVTNFFREWGGVILDVATVLFSFTLVGKVFAGLEIAVGYVVSRFKAVKEVVGLLPSVIDKVKAVFIGLFDFLFPNLKTVTGLIASFFATIATFFGMEGIYNKVKDYFNETQNAQEPVKAAQDRLNKALGIDQAEALKLAKKAQDDLLKANQVELLKATEQQVQKLAQSYRDMHDSMQQDIKTIPLAPEEADYTKGKMNAEKKYQDAVIAFQEKQKTLGIPEGDAKAIEGLKLLKDEYDKALTVYEQDAAAKKAATHANEAYQFSMGEIYKQADNFNNIQRQIADVGLPLVEKKYKDIIYAAQDAETAQLRAMSAARGVPISQLPEADKAAVHEAAAASIEKERSAMEALVAAEQKNDLRLTILKHQYDQQATLRKLQDDINRTTLSETEQKYYDIGAAADEAAKAEIRLAAEKAGIKPEDLPIEQVKAYYEANFAGIDQLIAKTRELQAVQEEQMRKAFVLKEHNANLDKLQAIQDDIAKSSMTEIEKKYYDIDAAAKQSAESELRALAVRKGLSRDELDAETVKEYYKAAYQGTEQLKSATAVGYANSRSFATGWKQALNTYTEDATNAANQAQRMFKTTTQGMEDMIVKFAKTGKFEWKSFLATVVEELLRSQITMLLSNILNGGKSGTGGNGLIGGITDMLGLGGDSGIGGAISSALGGGSSGSKGSGVLGTANNPMYVIIAGSQGGNTMYNAANNKNQQSSSKNKSNNPLTSLTGGTPTNADNWWDNTKNDWNNAWTGNSGASAENRSSYGVLQNDQNSGSTWWDPTSWFDDNSSSSSSSDSGSSWYNPSTWFSGNSSSSSSSEDDGGNWWDAINPFKATGGNIPLGQVGIVGENGPEYVRGPAHVTTNSQSQADGLLGGNTNVTYNINAVDAQSFKAMIAADPSFIYAVSMQGARGMPKR
jgi:lambda family phage tail tape measure protein